MREPVLSDKCSPRVVRYGTQIKLNYTLSLRRALWMNLKGNVKLIEASTCQSNPNLTVKLNQTECFPLRCAHKLSPQEQHGGASSLLRRRVFNLQQSWRADPLSSHCTIIASIWKPHGLSEAFTHTSNIMLFFTATRENLGTSIYIRDHMMYSPQRIKALQAKHNSRETHVSSLHPDTQNIYIKSKVTQQS